MSTLGAHDLTGKYSGTHESFGPQGFVLMGGLDPTYRKLSSPEVFGLDDCLVPDLPEVRFDHGSFTTDSGSIAVCGGWWSGKPWSSDCLILNTTSKQWERGLLGEVLEPVVIGVVSLDAGTLMMHKRTSSFLARGSQEWIAGPSTTEEVQCVAGISPSSFLAFLGKLVRQYDSNVAGRTTMGNDGWLQDGEWPFDLQVERRRPACATLGATCVIAGGRDENGELLKSVEVIYLNSKSLGKGGDMLKPRDHFQLIVVGTTLLAVGGHNEQSIEMWEEESWKEAPMSLDIPRTHFSALVASASLFCSEEPLPPHSCPTVDGGTCVFPFTNGRPNMGGHKFSSFSTPRISNIFYMCQ